MSLTLDRLHGAYTRERVPANATTSDFAWHAYAVVLAATLVVIGLLWDISWHMSIGRDTFWTPAHLVIQGGGLIAGLGSGILALRLSFRGTDAERASAVSFWGFRAPFGAWVCVLGCGAMLTSAPFDDWWHNAYGLDVRIVSPPHVLLGLGMLGIVLGALLRTLALQNRPNSAERARASAMFAWCSGLYVTIIAVLLMEWSGRPSMHSGSFYIAYSLTMPLFFSAIAVAGRVRWPATTAAAVYMVVMAGTSWFLMLFPAVPKLGPIYHDITHYVPLDFPVLLVLPAFALDLAWKRVASWPVLRAGAALGIAYFLTLIAVQWPLSEFVMTHGRNWFFHADNFVYFQSIASERFAFQFRRTGRLDTSLELQLASACAGAVIASAAGISRGRWMTRVQR